MNALGLAVVMAFWEVRRRAALAAAASATRHGRPALAHLRQSSRCHARLDKLSRLAEKAAHPRSVA